MDILKLSQSEIKSEDIINYGWKQARQKLAESGYEVTTVATYTTLMNRFAVYEGDFVFNLKEKTKTVKKTLQDKTSNSNLDKTNNVSKLKEETKKTSIPQNTRTTNSRNTSKRKK